MKRNQKILKKSPLEMRSEKAEHIAPLYDEMKEKNIGRYFHKVRQYPLLTIQQERKMWGQIKRLRVRIFRTLFLSPVSLPVLSEIAQELCMGMFRTDRALERANGESEDSITREDVVETLKDSIRSLAEQKEYCDQIKRVIQGGDRKTVRIKCSLRMQYHTALLEYCKEWEALPLTLWVHQRIHAALLEMAMAQPNNKEIRSIECRFEKLEAQHDPLRILMLNSNLRLVIHAANFYRRIKVPFLDVIQEGNFGLMRAYDKFDPDHGVKFATYATWWIHQAIRRGIGELSHLVRLPNHILEKIAQLYANSEKLRVLYQREPTATELACSMEVSEEKVIEFFALSQEIKSTNEPLYSDDGTAEFGDLIKDSNTDPPTLEIEAEELRQSIIKEVLGTFAIRDRTIFAMRHGLEEYEEHTLQQIGDHFGLSRERVRQIDRNLIEKIKRSGVYTAFRKEFGPVQ